MTLAIFLALLPLALLRTNIEWGDWWILSGIWWSVLLLGYWILT